MVGRDPGIHYDLGAVLPGQQLRSRHEAEGQKDLPCDSVGPRGSAPGGPDTARDHLGQKWPFLLSRLAGLVIVSLQQAG